MFKQDIHIYVPSGRPNGWTKWAEHFSGLSARGMSKAKKVSNKFFKFFFQWATPFVQLVLIKQKVAFISLYPTWHEVGQVFRGLLAECSFLRLEFW